jgi:hypothetical protein
VKIIFTHASLQYPRISAYPEDKISEFIACDKLCQILTVVTENYCLLGCDAIQTGRSFKVPEEPPASSNNVQVYPNTNGHSRPLQTLINTLKSL